MNVVVRVDRNYETQSSEIRVTRHDGGGNPEFMSADGSWELVQIGHHVPAVWAVPDWLMPDLRSALGQSTNAALEEALRVERGRVDKVLDKALA